MNQQWTQTPPTEPGWYWYTNKYADIIGIKKIIAHKNDLFLYSHGIIELRRLDEFAELNGYWLGPITPPEPPEEKP